jgi:2-oxoglutarate dehydrogenase E1 component
VVHGDAALCGQGVVYESLQMADLKGFSPQGVVHVVVNNQIGFTTTPREFRSGYQSTEVTKCVECPIFHVNGDEPDLVDQVM